MRAGRLWAWAVAGSLAVAIGATWQRPDSGAWNSGHRDALRFVDVVRRTDTDDTLESLVAHERYAEAFRRALSALRLRLDTLGALHPSTLSSLRRVGTVAHLSEDQRLSGEIFDALLPALRDLRSSHPLELCEALIRRGYTARYVGERERAGQFYDEAERTLPETMAERTPLKAFLLQARADRARNPDPEQAIGLYRSALQLRERASGVSLFTLADNEVWTGFTLAQSGRWSEARPHFDVSRRILAAIGITDHSLLGTLDGMNGEDLLVRGRWDEAIASFARSAAQVERTHVRFAPGFSRAIHHTSAFNLLAADALARGASDEAWALRERALAGLHADSAVFGRWPVDEPATFERARDLSLRLLDATRQWEVSGASWTPATAPILLRRLEAKAALDEVRAAHLAAHPLPLPDLSRVRSLLDPETAMIGWLEVHVGDATHPISSKGWAYVLRRDEPVHWVRLWETHDLSEWTAYQDFSAGIDRLERAATWPERVLPDAQMLDDLKGRGRRYFDPLRPHLKGIRRLVISGEFHMLADCFVGPDGRYAAEDFEFVHTPSAATLQVLSQSGAETAARAPGSILAVGAPDATGRLPRLPFLQSESASVSKVFPRAVRLDSPAGLKTRLDALARSGELAGFDVIHLAGHALSDPAPARRAIVIGTNPSERLTVEDVALSWRIRARLVTFSACGSSHTGGGKGGEPLGFTAATLEAGGANVLSSQWPVDDRAALLLMSRFYENLTGAGGPPMTPSRALFDAKASLRARTDPDGSHPFEHPAYWAGWTLLGTGQ